jgi:enediyne biosynthesis protein E4
MTHSRAVPLLFTLLLGSGLGCQSKTPPPVGNIAPVITSSLNGTGGADGPDIFSDITTTSGIVTSYRNGEEVQPPNLSILESLGGGLAVIDFNKDGLADLYFPGGGYFSGADNRTILGHVGKLYRNDGNLKFTDVTAAVGLATLSNGQPWFYSHAAGVADYDNDGFPDLLVSGWQRIVLFHNEPDGAGGRKFVDVSSSAGLDKGITWATSVGWADFDGDGLTDLFVGQYVNWSFNNHPNCNYDGKTPDVCPPKRFSGLQSKVYRNLGGGKFADVSDTVGLAPAGEQASKTLGILVIDVNDDRKPDVYAANDTVANFLYINQSTPGTIKFVEKGLTACCALDGSGSPNGSMGVDSADPECTGKPVLWMTNYENEFHALYRNRCEGDRITFVFATQSTGIGAIGQKFVGWGTQFVDLDHDGWEDIVITNGHAIRHPTGTSRKQKPVLFHNRNGKFVEIGKRGGSYFTEQHLGRGYVAVDLDNDGKVDAVFANMNEPAAVLRNVCPTDGKHWLGVELVGLGNRDCVGAKVMLEAGGRTQTRFAKGGGSYASSPDRRMVFGMATATKIDKLTVIWPDGRLTSMTDLAIDKYHTIKQVAK